MGGEGDFSSGSDVGDDLKNAAVVGGEEGFVALGVVATANTVGACGFVVFWHGVFKVWGIGCGGDVPWVPSVGDALPGRGGVKADEGVFEAGVGEGAVALRTPPGGDQCAEYEDDSGGEQFSTIHDFLPLWA